MKTRLDVVELAFRRLGIKAEDEGLTADQISYASDMLDMLHAELAADALMSWWPDQIEDQVAIALGNLLAVEIGPSYSVATEPRGRAFARVMAAMRRDNRTEIATEPLYY